MLGDEAVRVSVFINTFVALRVGDAEADTTRVRVLESEEDRVTVSDELFVTLREMLLE